jgi:hypothetical protein
MVIYPILQNLDEKKSLVKSDLKKREK